MNETVFRSDTVPAAERFDYWQERLGQTHAPMHLSSEHAHDYRAVQRILDLGAVSVWPATYHPLVFRRTAKQIRQSDPEVFHLSLVLNGCATAAWKKRNTQYRPYDLHCNDSSVPYEIHTHGEMIRSIGLEIPKALLPLPRGAADRVVGARLPGRTGMGLLLAQFLTRLADDTSSYLPSDGPRLGTVVTDLVAVLFAHTLETADDLPPETHQRILLLRIQDFIRQNLHDAQLTPAGIAAAHHISVRYLHRLFCGEGTTVAARIRRLRLEAAHHDLTDPALRSTPIHAIAHRWGYSRASEFSRAFRAAYGIAPKDYRQRHLG
ncbi:helix-turn-helix domain-containing protein [Streptomyces sp. NPDC001922]|uniref:AraC-like ligand-binding domain-containing protein n=1 Tax=Streptomyces sp. NPDC001922 TaxID=3364624 RepID=UPI0036A61AC7